MPPHKQTREERTAFFRAHINRRGPKKPHMRSRCWLWTGGFDRDGYGHFYLGGPERTQIKAHRFAWLLANPGEQLTSRDIIRHCCDTPACVRDSHLLRGTNADNSKDMVERDRSFHPRGGLGPAKLTQQEVDSIRSLSGSLPRRNRAEQFGVSVRHIGRIVTGECW